MTGTPGSLPPSACGFARFTQAETAQDDSILCFEGNGYQNATGNRAQRLVQQGFSHSTGQNGYQRGYHNHLLSTKARAFVDIFLSFRTYQEVQGALYAPKQGSMPHLPKF